MSDTNQNNHSASEPNDAWEDAWDDARVTAYVLGELDGEEAKAFETQLKSDPELDTAVQESREITDQLSALFAGESGSGLDEERREKILAASTTEGVTGQGDIPIELASSTSVRRWAPWIVSAAAATLLGAGVFVPSMMRNDRTMTHVDIAIESETDEILSSDSMSVIIDESKALVELQEESSLSLGDAEGMGGGGRALPARESSRELSRVDAPQQSSRESLSRKKLSSRLESTQVAAAEIAAMPETTWPEPAFTESVVRESAVGPTNVARAATAAPVSAEPSAPTASAPTLEVPKPSSGPKPSSDLFGRSMPAVESGQVIMELKQQKSSYALRVNGAPKPQEQSVSGEIPRPISLDGGAEMAKETSVAMEGEQESKLSVLGFKKSKAPLGVANRELLERIASNRKKGLNPLSKEVQATIRSRFSRPKTEELRLLEAETDELSVFFRSGDRYESITENEFKPVSENPRSTFSVDVDTASYSKVRRSLLNGTLPDPNAVRIEELINYFDYDYEAPAADAKEPFATSVTIASCPWNPKHRLARVALQGKQIAIEDRPPCNLVFLLDTSGSMNRPNKLPLVVEGMKMLTKQLTEKDRVAIVVYAGSAGVVLDSTPASEGKKIRKALKRLSAGGSTNGSAGIRLAYATARDNFIDGGVNRVILCTDGDFNVGTSSTNELVDMVKEESSGGIFLTALGFGMDNHNDAMMEQISGKGNGNYAFIDTSNEAHKVLVRQTNSTLVTIAKDVKLRLEFNPRAVSSYRLIGYENRVMASKDFNDDKKDAGEIGAGHQVTALYEIVPATSETTADGNSDQSADADRDEDEDEDALRYQEPAALSEAASSNEMLTLELRYKQPDADKSVRIEKIARDEELDFSETDADFRFASAVASFGMQLRGSDFAGTWTMDDVRKVAGGSGEGDEFGLRNEFMKLIDKASQMRGRN